jgi:hypothetical protein
MLKSYPPKVFELLAELNTSALHWLTEAVKGSVSRTEAEAPSASSVVRDSNWLYSIVASVNLWVGRGTMLIDSPSVERACEEFETWAGTDESRVHFCREARALLVAVQEFEIQFNESRSVTTRVAGALTLA